MVSRLVDVKYTAYRESEMQRLKGDRGARTGRAKEQPERDESDEANGRPNVG